MIAVRDRSKRNPAIAHLAEPIQFAVERQVLKYAQYRHEKGQDHGEPCERSPVGKRAKSLRRQKEQDHHAQQEQEFSSCGKPRSRKPKRPLNEHYQRQRRQREKQLRENDFSPVIGVEKLLRPEYQQNSAETFED